MKEKDLNFTFSINYFASHGLNRMRNFLQSPKCEDCGEPERVLVKDDKDLGELCSSLLFKHGCDRSAIFCIKQSGEMIIFLKVDDEFDGIAMLSSKEPGVFAGIDAEFRLCCYGLMIEAENGEWEICE